jgi:hypothetical protein
VKEHKLITLQGRTMEGREQGESDETSSLRPSPETGGIDVIIDALYVVYCRTR